MYTCVCVRACVCVCVCALWAAWGSFPYMTLKSVIEIGFPSLVVSRIYINKLHKYKWNRNGSFWTHNWSPSYNIVFCIDGVTEYKCMCVRVCGEMCISTSQLYK